MFGYRKKYQVAKAKIAYLEAEVVRISCQRTEAIQMRIRAEEHEQDLKLRFEKYRGVTKEAVQERNLVTGLLEKAAVLLERSRPFMVDRLRRDVKRFLEALKNN